MNKTTNEKEKGRGGKKDKDRLARDGTNEKEKKTNRNKQDIHEQCGKDIEDRGKNEKETQKKCTQTNTKTQKIKTKIKIERRAAGVRKEEEVQGVAMKTLKKQQKQKKKHPTKKLGCKHNKKQQRKTIV